jgi:hypothetical protein
VLRAPIGLRLSLTKKGPTEAESTPAPSHASAAALLAAQPQPIALGQIYVNESQAAKRLGQAIKTLQSWRFRRCGPPYAKLGRSVRYDVRELDAWVAAQTIRSAP